MSIQKAQWAKPFRKRCRSRITKRFLEYGRCDLQPHTNDIPHCLNRKTFWIRWFDADVHITMPKPGEIS
jgi:hypothetical protein